MAGRLLVLNSIIRSDWLSMNRGTSSSRTLEMAVFEELRRVGSLRPLLATVLRETPETAGLRRAHNSALQLESQQMGRATYTFRRTTESERSRALGLS